MSRIIETITKQIPPDPWITDPEIENLCCEVIDMPVCKEKIESWRGYTQEEILERLNIDVDDSGRDADGNIVEVRLKNDNQSGLCGEQVTRQIEQAKACCDGVTQIVWDEQNSIEVIADNSNGYIYVTGGRTPYTWSVRGNGFWLNSVGTIRDAETDEPWIRIFTLNSCGPCTVTVTDGCSEITEYIRSTVGQWVIVDSGCHVLEDDPDTYFDDTARGMRIGNMYGNHLVRFIVGYGVANRGTCCGVWPMCSDATDPQLDCVWDYISCMSFDQWACKGLVTVRRDNFAPVGRQTIENDCGAAILKELTVPPEFCDLGNGMCASYSTFTKSYNSIPERLDWQC